MAKQPLQPVSHSEFLTRLGDLFSSQPETDPSSIFLTQKRLSYGTDTSLSSPATSPPPTSSATTIDLLADLHPPHPLPILIRATNGRRKHKELKIKISTVVQPDDLEAFFVRYAEVCRAGMGALRKRDRKGRTDKKKKKVKSEVEKKA